ncbi:MAG: DUF502 domain-containing protein [Candidatus Aureabacteria bacterium]|nr:DUF502 domain-containing protein [Candidatus Auribacterota bacterium]
MEKKTPTTGAWARSRQHVRGRLISGFLFLLPIGITILIVRFLYNFTAGLLVPILARYFGKLTESLIVVISVAASAGLIYLLGVVTTHVLGKKLVNLGEAIILRLPILKSVYGASKQVVETFSSTNREAFKSVVMLEFPRKGVWSLGFATGAIEDAGVRRVKVYLPTCPNPTTGFFLILSPSEVVQTELSVEDAIKIIVSGGILSPPGTGRLLSPPPATDQRG